MDGVSVILRCYNSSGRIKSVLNRLKAQKTKSSLKWEIVLIDNNSTDNTVGLSKKTWREDQLWLNIEFKVFHESRQGLWYARQKGVLESKYDFLIFLDDDNLLATDYLQNAYELMRKDKQIGVLGGKGLLDSSIEVPDWFHKFKNMYAVGAQNDWEGDITESKGFVWGAGCVIRKNALSSLLNSSYELKLVGRKGKSLSAGEDSEMCFVLRILGYKIWYSSKLIFEHRIESHRINWKYLLNLNIGFGRSNVILNLFRYFNSGSYKPNPFSWLMELFNTIWHNWYVMLIYLLNPSDFKAVKGAFQFGYIRELLRINKGYSKAFDDIAHLSKRE